MYMCYDIYMYDFYSYCLSALEVWVGRPAYIYCVCAGVVIVLKKIYKGYTTTNASFVQLGYARF